MLLSDLTKKYLNKISSLDLELIIGDEINQPRAFVIAHPEYALTKKQEKNCESNIKRRIKGEPYAYISGEKEFYGFNFKVNKNVLIPRPETEMIIEEVLKTQSDKIPTLFIDVGTGSGAIIITLAKLLGKNYHNEFIGIDISAKAINVAKLNSKQNKISSALKFYKSDLFYNITKRLCHCEERSDEAISSIAQKEIDNVRVRPPRNDKIMNFKRLIITANLPYLTPTQFKNSPSIKYEPKTALVAGRDGLKDYRRFFAQIKQLLEKIQKPIIIFCEFDPSQTKKIKKIIKKNIPSSSIEIKKDLCGLDRLVIVKLSQKSQ